MKYLICRIATVALLTMPLAFGASDAYSAKKSVDRSDAVPASKGSVDTPKVEKVPTRSEDSQRQVTPRTTTTTSPRIALPSSAGENLPLTPTTDAQQSAATIENNWISINHGGATEVSAGNLRLGISIAQPVAGFVEAGNYQLGLGYWYGAAAGAASVCDCPLQADIDGNAVRDNIDLNLMIRILFLNGDDVQDQTCPASRVDFNCDGTPDNLDLNWLINHLFLNGPPPCNPCDCVSYPSDCPTFP